MKKHICLLLVSLLVIAAMCVALVCAISRNKVSDETGISASSETENVSSNNDKATTERPEKVLEVFPFECDFAIPVFQRKIFIDSENGNVLPYRLFVPADYDASNQYPVILFLHGAGEIGTDNQKQLENMQKMFENNGDLVSQAIVVCPQSNAWWNLDRQFKGDQKGTLGSVLHLLEEIKSNYSCDNNRIYVTGLSMGGYATWSLLQEYGDIFAAGMPVCGGGDYTKGYVLKEIPIRIYHSKDDPTVPFYNSKSMYDAIINAGGNKVNFIALDGLGHNSWDYAYSDREAFCWLFAQNKSQNPTGKYEYIPCFRIIDEKGETIISDEDIVYVYHGSFSNAKEFTPVYLSVNATGREKLKKAYTSNASKVFTVYWSAEKLYTFTADGPPIDNKFSIIDVFDKKAADAFCKIMETVIS